MPRDGAGNYSLPQPAFQPNTVISSSAVNSDFSDVASALTASLAANGETPVTANLPMSNFRHTGVSNATARNQYASAGQVQDGALVWGGTTGGTASAMTATVTPGSLAYVSGLTVRVTAAATNAAGSTFDLNALGAKKMYYAGVGSPVQAVGGEMQGGCIYELCYLSTLDSGAGGWLILNTGPGWQTLQSVTLVGASTSGTLLLLSGMSRFRLTLQDMTVGSASQQLLAQFSNDAGATWLTTNDYYRQVHYGTNALSVASYANPVGSIALTAAMPAASSQPYQGVLEISPGSASLKASIYGSTFGLADTALPVIGLWGGYWNGASARMNALRVIPSSGVFSGTVVLEGCR